MLRVVNRFVLTLLMLLTLKFLTYCQGGEGKDEGGRRKDEAKAPREWGIALITGHWYYYQWGGRCSLARVWLGWRSTRRA